MQRFVVRATLTLAAVASVAPLAGAQKVTASNALSKYVAATPQIVVAGTNPSAPAYLTPVGGAWDGVVAEIIHTAGGDFICSGSLIDRRTILTAAHCVTNGSNAVVATSVDVYFFPPSGGGVATILTSNIVNVNAAYTGQVVDAHDVATLILPTGAPSDITPYSLYRHNGVGQNFNVSGFGRRGTGLLGANTGAGSRRQGNNRFDFLLNDPVFDGCFSDPMCADLGSADQSVYIADFDNGVAANDASCNMGMFFGTAAFCNLGLGLNEVITSNGDSGGPEFIGGQVAGITSFGLTFGTFFGDIDNSLNSTFGEFAGYVSVDYNAAWIDAHTAPEPATFVLMGTGLVAVVGVARRRAAKK